MNVQPIKPYDQNQTFKARPIGRAKTIIVNALEELHTKYPKADWLQPSEELNTAKGALNEISRVGDNIGLEFIARNNSATRDIDFVMTEEFAYRPICSITKEMTPLEKILAIRDGLLKSSINDVLNSKSPFSKAMEDFTEIF